MNHAMNLTCRRLGDEEFQRRLEHRSVAQPTAGFGSRTRLTMQTNRAKKTVGSATSHVRCCNSVGAVGYAVVLADDRMPENDFFRPDIRFRIRLRHSNMRCSDDAGSCQREAAIKFADQNEDGPLDLILLTGRTALARNCNDLMGIMNAHKPEELKNACLRDPFFYFAFVDGLRRAPASYADLVYHSQIAYLFIPKDGQSRLVKFRLVPGVARASSSASMTTASEQTMSEFVESGRLDDAEQERPWFCARSQRETRHRYYLRHEFMRRMEGECLCM